MARRPRKRNQKKLSTVPLGKSSQGVGNTPTNNENMKKHYYLEPCDQCGADVDINNSIGIYEWIHGIVGPRKLFFHPECFRSVAGQYWGDKLKQKDVPFSK